MLITVRCWAHVPRYRSCSCLAIRSVSSTTHCVVLANEVFPWLTLSIEDRPFRSPKDAFFHAEMVFRFSSTEEKKLSRETTQKPHTKKKMYSVHIDCTCLVKMIPVKLNDFIDRVSINLSALKTSGEKPMRNCKIRLFLC